MRNMSYDSERVSDVPGTSEGVTRLLKNIERLFARA